ncbi:MAG: low specificity L-threonine aldolase, partial [Proteobacteria bacterium]|nr:low specificity L-threonine aldolase [Pseudomonadota bacterium]
SGRIDPAALDAALGFIDSAHHQSPAALSLTNTTEYGTLYPTQAAEGLARAAKARGLAVHLDGARLCNAAASGFDLRAIAKMGVDILVFGGTKAGMTPSEALVVFDRKLAPRLDARLKQSGQLPSKGRFYAAPFIGMLEDGAGLRHAAHANAMARRLAAASPFRVVHPVEANGVFLEIDEAAHARLTAAGWAVYRVLDGSVRFMCSWATTPESVDELAAALRQLG